MAEFVTDPVAVRSPATSANLGPGFDSFGLALGLHDTVVAAVTKGGVEIDVTGENAASVPRDETHLVVRAMRETFAFLRVSQPGLRLRCTNVIPHARGLGSSAAAIVSGITLAEALVDGARLTDEQVLNLAAELEGHPDNVAACIFGAFTIAWGADGRLRVAKFDVHPEIRPAVLIPPQPVSTELARGLLPKEVPHHEASANSARAGLLATALTAAPEHLLAGTEDFLHQRFRHEAMPQSVDLAGRMRSAGVPAVVSGAGPTVLALGTVSAPVELDRWLPIGWQGKQTAVDSHGTQRNR